MGSNLSRYSSVDFGVLKQPCSQTCAQCEDEIEYQEEVFCIQIVRGALGPNGLELYIAQDDVGDFLYEPYFIHFKCWEEIQEELKEGYEDEPPIPALQQAIADCYCCGSAIQAWELLGSLTLGELHLSKRMAPRGSRGEDFVQSGDPFLMCIYCLNLINTNWLTLWSEGVSENGECDDCVQSRCWRFLTSNSPCTCPCHYETKEPR